MTYDYAELDAERTKVMQEHGCECETYVACTHCGATAGTLIDELAMLRVYRRKVEEGIRNLVDAIQRYDGRTLTRQAILARLKEIEGGVSKVPARATPTTHETDLIAVRFAEIGIVGRSMCGSTGSSSGSGPPALCRATSKPTPSRRPGN